MKLIGRGGRDSATLPLRISPDSTLNTTRIKKGKKRLADVKSFSLEEPLHEDGLDDKIGHLTRSKTYDPPLSIKSTESDPSTERRKSITSNLPKHNVTFHKIFRGIPEDEELKDSFTCALQKEVLYQGRLYISSNYIGFFCIMLRKEIKVLIPISSVTILKKANTALLVPNALSVRTVDGDKYLFGSLRNRELCYQAVRAVCTHLQDGSACSTPMSSTADPASEQNCKILNSSHSDLELNLNESDSVVLNSIAPEGPLKEQSRLRFSASEVDGLSLGSYGNGDICQEKLASDDTNRTHWARPSAVNILLIIYMLLVAILLISSGYIGLRIIELENQLNIMGAWPKEDATQGSKDS
ncbi:GRAM domain-containing protein 2B isoform X2 [Bombina bombina]|uniref:GRAM domain-containing protein 2B isoform X2 n=1 Tax=Bombina bombina TaxID=8345 RepID=UPI00235B2367|nr:GRAM domain-containing protein 2B isoform X2 [Bombina bombina]